MKLSTETSALISFGQSHHVGVMVAAAVAVVAIFILRGKMRRARIESFLFNNQYHAVDPKTDKFVYPNVVFRKDRIIIANCIRKTIEQIQEEKGLWEQAFHSEIGDKRISEIRREGRKIVMALI